MMTAINFLIEWTENINWKNHLLNSVLQKKSEDIDTITKEIIDIIANNKTVNLILAESEHTTQSHLLINEIKAPINISALSEEAVCQLGKKLNVFYGENGSGKSSYVKVFRKLAENYYTNEKNLGIMSNVYITDKTPDLQTITICYSCDGNESCTQCIDINLKHPDLSKINVFDSSSLTPLINSDLTFTLQPQGFNYFSQLTDLIDLIKAKLQELITNNQNEQNKLFSDSSFGLITKDITTITTNMANKAKFDEFLKINYALPENIDELVNALDNQVKELQSANPVNLIKILSTQKTKLEALKKNFEVLSSKVNSQNIDMINTTIKQYDELLERERKNNEEFGRKVQHIDNVNTEWINFIESAKRYYKSVELELPKENNRCILCGQALDKHHINIISSCFSHIDSATNRIRKEIDRKIQSYYLPELPIAFSTEDELLFGEEKRYLIERVKTTVNLIDKNRKIFKESIEKKQHIPGKCSIDFEDIINEIFKEVEDIDGRLTTLGKSNQEISELIVKLTDDKNTLLRIKKVNACKEQFRRWYEYKTTIDSINKMKNLFTTTALSTKAKEAFNKLVADDYINTFNDYCEKLGVPNVNISLTSKKGQTKRGKYIVREDIKVTEIMSEGEQKAIALAEFATDLKIRKNYCSTLFDDPVTSFDYKRAEKIADMIYEISKDKQVIVFTHNIMFYYYLYNCCAKDPDKENKFFKIDEFDRDNKGLISLSTEGRLETLNEITKKIKNNSHKINSKSCLGDELEQTLKATYSDIRTWCELIVEEGFLKKIIRRYEPNIMFKPVSKINPEFVDYIPAVSELFDKSCRYMLGHSQPTETQNVKATREEFNKDFVFLCELTDKYK